MIKDDAKLLRDYVEQHSESAFNELTGRHIDLVYSTALRMVYEPSLAEDVVQMVFVQLVTKASTIRNGNTLPGWLYRVRWSMHCGLSRYDVDMKWRQTCELKLKPRMFVF